MQYDRHDVNPVFKEGDHVVCINPDGYRNHLKEDDTYYIADYSPPHRYEGSAFMWPAYVQLNFADGTKITCHAHRFRHIIKEGSHDS